MSTIHVRELTSQHFDTVNYDRFWRFLVERQRIWVRRAHLEMKRPWTTDRVLNNEFITNVYRELDPGTEYVLDFLANPEANGGASDEDVLLNVMCYRLIGSQPAVYNHIGFLDHTSFSSKEFVRKMYTVPGGSKPFGDAYRVAGYNGEEGDTKVENISSLLKKLARMIEEWWRRMLTSPTPRDLYTIFTTIPGFGEFLSNQCMVDVLMLDNLRGEERNWQFGLDEWIQPGPGARKGISALMSNGMKPASLQLVMAYLRDRQEGEFESRSLQFPYLLNPDDTIKTLTMANMQTALCEFSKYVRSIGHVNVRRFEATSSPQPFDIILTAEEIEALRDVTSVTNTDMVHLEESFTVALDVNGDAEEVTELPLTPIHTSYLMPRPVAAQNGVGAALAPIRVPVCGLPVEFVAINAGLQIFSAFCLKEPNHDGICGIHT